jgi:hypothetical protein
MLSMLSRKLVTIFSMELLIARLERIAFMAEATMKSVLMNMIPLQLQRLRRCDPCYDKGTLRATGFQRSGIYGEVHQLQAMTG